MIRYLIIGGSAGAIGGVEGIRKHDPNGEIAVVSEEDKVPYSRPAIGEYLDGRIDSESVHFGSLNFWRENSVQLLSGTKASSISLGDRTVGLENGQFLSFDRLLLATGSRPFVPNMEGTNRKGFCTFVNLSDVERIKQELPRAKSAVVIGGGLIGVEASEALVNLGIRVTVVELRGWLLNLLLDREAAGIVETEMKFKGIKLVTGQSVKVILGRNENDRLVGGVLLSGGDRVDCDLIVSAVGVTPRTELAAQAGLKVNKGILVDSHMQTSSTGVYACGDAAEAYDMFGGVTRVLAMWPLARLGGRIAGENMAGSHVEYSGRLAMSALRYFGIPIVSVGLDAQESTEEFEILKRRDGRSFRKLVLRNNRIVGFTMVQDIEAAGIFHNLIRTQADISSIKGNLLAPDFGFAHLPDLIRKKTLMEAWT